MTPRVRFAPSPTGNLHVGGARTALYNHLFARHHGGTFILRIEDTDLERSQAHLSEQIVRALEWLGLRWDEGPYFQSERRELYRARVDELLAKGSAYRCFCSVDELAAKRKAAENAKQTYRYDGACRDLAAAAVAERLAAGRTAVTRCRVSGEEIVVRDRIRGDVRFPAGTLDDFVILRSDGSPTYHLSVTVDDADMRITHVIRGDDHLSNTPKHVELFRALGATPPEFAHLPLILGPDKKRLSKRYGATSVEEYRELGILPDALVNFLALLGWSAGDDREKMTRDELAAAFTLDRVHGAPAVFDHEKLLWLNGQYMTALPAAALLEGLNEMLPARARQFAALIAVIELNKSRSRTLRELAEAVEPYTTDQVTYDPDAVAPVLKDPDLAAHLQALREAYATIESFADTAALEAELRRVAADRSIKAAVLIHPLRLALTGKKAGPPLFDIAALLGKEQTLSRLDGLLNLLHESHPDHGRKG